MMHGPTHIKRLYIYWALWF